MVNIPNESMEFCAPNNNLRQIRCVKLGLEIIHRTSERWVAWGRAGPKAGEPPAPRLSRKLALRARPQPLVHIKQNEG